MSNAEKIQDAVKLLKAIKGYAQDGISDLKDEGVENSSVAYGTMHHISAVADTALERIQRGPSPAELAKGVRIIAEKLSPKVGDLIVFRYPENAGYEEVKSIVAMVEGIAERFKDALFAALDDSYCIEYLDEEAMRRHGWVRVQDPPSDPDGTVGYGCRPTTDGFIAKVNNPFYGQQE